MIDIYRILTLFWQYQHKLGSINTRFWVFGIEFSKWIVENFLDVNPGESGQESLQTKRENVESLGVHDEHKDDRHKGYHLQYVPVQCTCVSK